MKLDPTDTMILSLLQANARISNADIARRIGLAASAVLERIRKLEQRGVITGYHARIAPGAVGTEICAFVQVRLTAGAGYTDALDAIAAMPEVQEVHETSGDFGVLLKVRCADLRAFGEVLNERVRSIDAVRDTSSAMVIGTVKESMMLPLDEG